jgi:GT2 family glycosyltransferase
VVNNSPENDSIEIENVIVLNNSNRGFSQANNIASKHAKGEYLFFLNADTLLQKDFTPIFNKEFGDKEFGVVGIGLKYSNGKYQLSYWNKNNFLNEFINKKSEKVSKDTHTKSYENYSNNISVKEVDWVSGAAMIINKVIFDRVYGFDEDYFLFYEDADLCKRINDIGSKIFYLPFDGLVHYKGENVNKSFSTDTYYYSKKSQLIYYKKHNNLANRILLRLYLIVRFSVKVVLKRNMLNRRIFNLVLGISHD